VGALRLRTVATKDRLCVDFPWKQGEEYGPSVILELDYWVLIPR
jgi:2-methylfumaryl-CoA hydratase